MGLTLIDGTKRATLAELLVRYAHEMREDKFLQSLINGHRTVQRMISTSRHDERDELKDLAYQNKERLRLWIEVGETGYLEGGEEPPYLVMRRLEREIQGLNVSLPDNPMELVAEALHVAQASSFASHRKLTIMDLERAIQRLKTEANSSERFGDRRLTAR